jgi:aminopeptidase
MEKDLQKTALENVQSIIRDVFEHDASHKAIVVYDERCELSRVLAQAYREALPEAEHILFDEEQAPQIIAALNSLKPVDFVALIQSSSFRLNEFRIRVELFKNGLKVIEHPHLDRMSEPADVETYVDSLAYDKAYYRGVGSALKARVDQAKEIIVESPGCALRYEGPFEDAKLNTGDYTGMKNWGGMFPIGEVFTEPKDLEKVSGSVKLHAFGDRHFFTNVPPVPIEIIVEHGVIVDTKDSTPEFDAVLMEIRDEEMAILRELGMGLNRAFTRARTVPDIGTYERKCGIHFSLGGKHAIYAKEGFSRKHSKFHVDVFADVTRVLIDGEVVFDNGQWQIKNS